MADLTNKVIKIKSITPVTGESNGRKWVRLDVVDDKDNKYTFWKTKKDGSDSAAFTYYKENKSEWDNGFMDGNVIEIGVGVDEQERSFENNQGKTIKFQQRTIRFFKELSEIDKALAAKNKNQQDEDINVEDIPLN